MIGKCTECGQPCNVIPVDFGIGAYEFWGAKSIDVQIEAVSDCCDAPAVNALGHLITIQNVKDQERVDNYY